MSCLEFFETTKGSRDRAKLLQEVPEETQLRWELERASDHSPEPIGADEVLVRTYHSPFHYDDETGTLKPTAFDDSADKGASVNRVGHTTLERIKDEALARVVAYNAANPGKPQRALIGYSEFQAAAARALHCAGPPMRRGAGVYDTALPQDRSHGDIFQIAPNTQGGRSVRAQLRELANRTLRRF